jgi:hypothetical protein
MKVRFRECLAGTTTTYNAGDEVELPDNVAERLVAADIAERVDEGKRESAVKKVASKATKE